MLREKLRIMPIGPGNLNDRLEVCWRHLEDWQDHELARESREWLETVNSRFSPSTFIAYEGNQPVGMIEFMPRDMLHDQDFCPCRKRKCGDGAVLPSLGTDYRDYLFITCLWVPTQYQHRGIGNSLLMQLLESQTFKHFADRLKVSDEKLESLRLKGTPQYQIDELRMLSRMRLRRVILSECQ